MGAERSWGLTELVLFLLHLRYLWKSGMLVLWTGLRWPWSEREVHTVKCPKTFFPAVQPTGSRGFQCQVLEYLLGLSKLVDSEELSLLVADFCPNWPEGMLGARNIWRLIFSKCNILVMVMLVSQYVWLLKCWLLMVIVSLSNGKQNSESPTPSENGLRQLALAASLSPQVLRVPHGAPGGG